MNADRCETCGATDRLGTDAGEDTPTCWPRCATPKQDVPPDTKREAAWKGAAMRLGESMADSGPDGYYLFSPDQWLNWCANRVWDLRKQLARKTRDWACQYGDKREAWDEAESLRAELHRVRAERDEARREAWRAACGLLEEADHYEWSFSALRKAMRERAGLK